MKKKKVRNREQFLSCKFTGRFIVFNVVVEARKMSKSEPFCLALEHWELGCVEIRQL